MTTQKATSAKESLPIGGYYSDSPASREQRVIYLDVSVERPLPLENTSSLSSLINEFESDPQMASLMSEARKELSAKIYDDEPETLSAIRLAAGLSQTQLAQRMNTSQSYVGRVESGRLDPGTDMVSKFASALGIDEEAAFRAVRNQIKARRKEV